MPSQISPYKPQKILLGLPSLGVGGLQNLILNGYSSMLAIAPRETEVTILVADTEQEYRGSLLTEFEEQITTAIFSVDSILEDPVKTSNLVSSLIANRGINIVHNVNNRHLYPTYPMLSTAGQISIIDQHFNAVGHVGNLQRHLDSVKKIITDNKEVKRQLIDKIGVDPEVVVPIQTGIDLKVKFNPHTYKNRSLPSINPSLPVISFVGRWAEEKGPDIFLEIVKELAHMYGNSLNYVFAGDGPMRKDLVKLLKRLDLADLVITPGLVDGALYLANSDFVVFPSRIDGYPVAIMESLALGAIPVASSVGGIPELIKTGETGLVVDSIAPLDFANAISKLLKDENLKREMKKRARAFAEQNFSLERMGQEYAQVILT